MPHAKKCPHCKKKVWDWFMEWYLQPQKGEIFRGQAAMDCPWCRGPVVYDYKTQELTPAPPSMSVYQRDERQATLTAMKSYPTLEDFLVSPLERKVATPFRLRYWPDIDLPLKRRKP
jgi:hypothetical protein